MIDRLKTIHKCAVTVTSHGVKNLIRGALLLARKKIRHFLNITRIFKLIYSRTPVIRTPIIRNAYYPNATLTKEIKSSHKALERQLRFKRKMRPKIKNHLTRARRAVFI